jgi:phosphatidylglycerol---prolipoprotein diacylglyceryl transferase
MVHNFDPVFIDLGIFQIRWYSLAYIAGIALGWLYAIKIIEKLSLKKNYFLVRREEFDELITYLVIGIVLGGRLGYVIFYNFRYYSENIIEVFKLWQGGMSFHGGLIGLIIAVYIYSKKSKTSFFKFADIISCVAPIGIFLGRIANFINGELYGKVSTLPWAIIFPYAGNVARHPSQIYEAILEGFILFILLNYLAFKKKLIIKSGYISGLFLIFYSILRIIAENFREPDVHIGYLFNYISMGTLLSLIIFFVGFVIILLIKKNE